jgi:hypothetical protein
LCLHVPMLTIKPYVADWRRCWRSTPMRFLAVGGAIQGAMVTMPAAVSEHLPEWVLEAGSIIAFICLVMAGLGIGKATRWEGHDVRPS